MTGAMEPWMDIEKHIGTVNPSDNIHKQHKYLRDQLTGLEAHYDFYSLLYGNQRRSIT